MIKMNLLTNTRNWGPEPFLKTHEFDKAIPMITYNMLTEENDKMIESTRLMRKILSIGDELFWFVGVSLICRHKQKRILQYKK